MVDLNKIIHYNQYIPIEEVKKMKVNLQMLILKKKRLQQEIEKIEKQIEAFNLK